MDKDTKNKINNKKIIKKNNKKIKKLKIQKGGDIISGITNLIGAFKGFGNAIYNEINLCTNIQKDLAYGSRPAPGAPN